IEAFLVVPKDQLPNEENCYCIKVVGESMAPVFSSGDIVAVDFSQKDPVLLEGAFVACRLGEAEVTVKQLKSKPNHFHLKAVNPDWEDAQGPLLVPKKDGVILGKVVWQWRKF
ncbi:MAG: LexA family protein, partial [Limisphaerales bacterium]